ncbi:MAG: hypothetical protein HKK66_04360 [Chlorobiaceae bacterium]|nr:hypothetical protein [Chlorobiaceae bacterium]
MPMNMQYRRQVAVCRRYKQAVQRQLKYHEWNQWAWDKVLKANIRIFDK